MSASPHLLDGLDDEVEALLVGEDVGCKAALVAHVARVLAVPGVGRGAGGRGEGLGVRGTGGGRGGLRG